MTKKTIQYQEHHIRYHRCHRQVRGELQLQLVLAVRHRVHGGAVHRPELVHPVPVHVDEEVPGEEGADGQVVEHGHDQLAGVPGGDVIASHGGYNGVC